MNCDYLKEVDGEYFKDIIKISDKIDRYLYSDPLTSLKYSRDLIEAISQKVCIFFDIPIEYKNCFELLEEIRNSRTVSDDYLEKAHYLRKAVANATVHFDEKNYDERYNSELLKEAKNAARIKHIFIGETAKLLYGIKEYPEFKLPEEQKDVFEFSKGDFQKSIQQEIGNLKRETPININHYFHNKNVYIPCGCGKSDKGFYICNVKKSEKCENLFAPYYAVVYSLFQQSLEVRKNFINPINKERYDSSIVYRLIMIVLLLVKNNYLSSTGKLDVYSIDGKQRELKYAISVINGEINKLAVLSGSKIPNISFGENKFSISLSSNYNASFYVEDCAERITEDRDTWFENNIIYNINIKNKEHNKILLDLLVENFGENFSSFKPGQLEVIANALNDTRHKICIMPTAAGKSLIFYFISLLRACPTFVVTPTEILIKDQIKNLKHYHNIDNVQFVDEGIDFKAYYPKHKLVYLTPETFLQLDFINRLIELNHKQLIGNVVLDEVHCISNWSHDFRPEYLMLSHNLMDFADKTGYLCFTATANYSVLKDIMWQLNLSSNCVIEPIKIKQSKDIHFIGCKNNVEVVHKSTLLYDNIIENDRVLCFFKNRQLMDEFYDDISENSKYNTDGYTQEDDIPYEQFAKGNLNGLLTDGELGIGINLENVSTTIHIGMPISQDELTQQSGRSGRDGRSSTNYIFYQNKNSIKNQALIDRSISTKKLISLLQKQKDDIVQVYDMLFAGVKDFDRFSKVVHTLTEEILHIGEPGIYTAKFKYIAKNDIDIIKKGLYFAYRLGIIYGWYLLKNSVIKNEFKVWIDPGKEERTLEYIKKRIKEYLFGMGNYRKYAKKVQDATSVSEVIDVYLEWYYEQFLYYHREQALNLLDALERESKGDKTNKNSSFEKGEDIEPQPQVSYSMEAKVIDEIESVMSETKKSIEQENNSSKTQEKISNESIEKLESSNLEFTKEIEMPKTNIADNSKSFVAAVEYNKLRLNQVSFHEIIEYSKQINEEDFYALLKYLEDEYSVKSDFLIFCYNKLLYNDFDLSRLNRIFINIDIEKKRYIMSQKELFKNLGLKKKVKTIALFLKWFKISEILKSIS